MWRKTILSKLTIGLILAVALSPGVSVAQSSSVFTTTRERMVRDDVIGNGIKNKLVISAMRSTRRHEFVALNLRRRAYLDMALPIGSGQTISSPFIVAFMTEHLDPKPTDKVLEIGTGSGYQAAVLSAIVKDVYTIEIVKSLGIKARRTLSKYGNVHTKIGDGFKGWPEFAPFDKIIVTCSPESVPKPLIKQLREGGRIVVPVGQRYQQILYAYTKTDGKLVAEELRPTFFVPMTGTAENNRQVKPDPANPKIANGGFEEFSEETNLPTAWYYLRQAQLFEGDAVEGENYLNFTNTIPGNRSQALQGFPVDGRKVQKLAVSFRIKHKDVRPGQSRSDVPLLGITYFDKRRAALGQQTIGPWYGTSDWFSEEVVFRVPVRAREASIRIGLFGAVGEIAFDDIKVEAVKSK